MHLGMRSPPTKNRRMIQLFVCKTCHVNGYTRFDQTVCTTCHEQIKADFMQSHLLAYGDNCLACHDGIDSYGHDFDHANAVFQLTGKHTSWIAERAIPGLELIADLKATPQDCAGCHTKDDAHKGQFGNGCGTCHTTQGWLPATFDHALTKFPLTGAHRGWLAQNATPMLSLRYSHHMHFLSSRPAYHAGLVARDDL